MISPKRRPPGAVDSWLAAAALLLGMGCGGDAVSAGASASASVAPPSSAAPPSNSVAPAASSFFPPVRQRPTPPAIALSNFQGQIRGAETRLEVERGALGARRALVDLLLDRAQLLGRPSDLERAIQLEREAPPAGKGEELTRGLLAATAALAVHRFSATLAALDAIEAPEGRTPAGVLRLRGATLAAMGRLGEALPPVQQVRALRPELGILLLEGKILGQMGRTDEARRAFDDAQAAYKNPAPFALADLFFERGLLAERQGHLDEAQEAYRRATELLPQHAHATLHLAALVPPKEGIALLEALSRTSEDPEVRGRLGGLRELDAPGSGKADVEAAAAAYQRLLSALPEAYADHAGWFYLGPGHAPDEALRWARKNLEVRPNAAAHELLLAAARAAKRPREEICAMVAEAKRYEWPSPALRDLLAAEACP